MPRDLLADQPRQPRDLLAGQSRPPRDLLAETHRQPINDRVHVATGGLLEGIPVLGPIIRGGADRVGAGIRSMINDTSYEDELAFVQGRSDELSEQHPVLDTGSKIAGAVAGTVPLVMAAPAAFGAGPGSLGARTVASGFSGGTLGGVDAAVRSGGDLDAAMWGAGAGLAAGLAGPLAGDLIGKGVSALTQRFGRQAPSAAQSSFARAVGSDAIDDMPARLAQLGPDAMPMDLGPNLQRQAGALAATPGRGQEIVRSAVAGRQAGAGARISSALDDALGQSVDTVALADDIIARRSAEARPLYEAAYAKPVPFTKEMESLLKRPSIGRALTKARSLAADEGIPSQQWFANVADDGTVAIQNVPDMRQLDLTKRALDDMIEAAKRGGSNNEARILTQQKNLLVGMMDKAVPEYQAARQAFSGPASVLDAMEEGQKAFRNSMTPNQLRKTLAGMGEAEREAYVQGARAQVSDIMGTARNDALAARSAFQKGYNREKLNMLVGEEQASRLLGSLDAETAFTRTRDVVTGNSETAARLAAQRDVGAGERAPGMIRNALNMRFGDAVADAGDKAIGSARSAAQGRANEELAKILTSRDPAAVTRAIQMVQAAQRRGDITAAHAREMIQSVTIGGGQSLARP